MVYDKCQLVIFFYSSMNVYDNEKITDKLVSYIISQWNSDCIFLHDL